MKWGIKEEYFDRSEAKEESIAGEAMVGFVGRRMQER
jgi:hypothetical protein